jgi:UDP-N-acetylglucosamine--N-acetylmuramyl-(pentapeptide) pyrophosphoryl-undecaprenol N-acetylglucosamine transferase
MKVIIAGGGTGGHLFPGIAVAEELVARGHEVRFVGTARGIEAKVCPRDGWALDLIDVGGLKGGGVLGLIKGLFRVPRAMMQSFALLRRHKPDLVIGVGGYASGPVVLAASLSGRPTAILEQNSVPGITNRMLGRVVGAVFGAFDAAQKFFPTKKYRLVGNPVRKRVREKLQAGTEAGHHQAGSVLVVGGSQGAHAVNELMCEAMKLLQAEGRAPSLTHQSGEKDAPELERRYREAGVTVDVRPFIDDMAAAYRAAALVVCRAGASTLAELTALGLPSILIPFPQAADDHQTVNARELEAKGAARVLVQKDTTPAELARVMRELLDAPSTLAQMGAAARQLGRPDAHAQIVDALESLAGRARTLPANTAAR